VKAESLGAMVFGLLLYSVVCSGGGVIGFRDTRGPLKDSVFSPHESSLCGPISLYLVCRSFGITRYSVRDIADMANAGADGTSMRGLEETCSRMGLWAESIQTDVKTLARLLGHRHVKAIALLEEGHFVFIDRCRSSKFRYTYYPSEPKWCSFAELEGAWTGYVLLVSMDPLPASVLAGDSCLKSALWGLGCLLFAGGLIWILRIFGTVGNNAEPTQLSSF